MIYQMTSKTNRENRGLKAHTTKGQREWMTEDEEVAADRRYARSCRPLENKVSVPQRIVTQNVLMKKEKLHYIPRHVHKGTYQITPIIESMYKLPNRNRYQKAQNKIMRCHIGTAAIRVIKFFISLNIISQKSYNNLEQFFILFLQWHFF